MCSYGGLLSTSKCVMPYSMVSHLIPTKWCIHAYFLDYTIIWSGKIIVFHFRNEINQFFTDKWRLWRYYKALWGNYFRHLYQRARKINIPAWWHTVDSIQDMTAPLVWIIIIQWVLRSNLSDNSTTCIWFQTIWSYTNTCAVNEARGIVQNLSNFPICF